MSQRVHHTAKPIDDFRRGTYVQLPNRRKPNGLWWAEGTQWKEFAATDKAARKHSGEHAYLVDVAPEAGILTLSTWDEVLAFTVEYGLMPTWGQGFFWQAGDTSRYDPSQDEGLTKRNCSRVAFIDWVRVAGTYDGIDIPDLAMTGRPRVEWLDIDWGVSSGCVWDSRLATVSRIETCLEPEDMSPSPR